MVNLRKRSLSLAGHQTSVALEAEFWTVLETMARARRESLAALMLNLDSSRGARPLASACRVAALAWVANASGRGSTESEASAE